MRFSFLPSRALRNSWLTIFLINTCLMTVEMVASRLLAPYIGISLTAWASVIATVFVAMAIGYSVGGRLADRNHASWLIGGCIGLAGIVVALMNPMAQFLGPMFVSSTLSLSAIALILSVAILALPSLLLASIYPMIVKRTISDLAMTGQSVGSLNAAAATGSIVGTFLTGFVWLMWVSTSTILWMMAIILLVIGIMEWVRAKKQIYNPLVRENTISSPSTSTNDLRSDSHQARFQPRVYKFLAFISGFALLSLELVAGRAVAPYIGVSIFTWTGVIGGILLGITLGNIAGGWLSDRKPSSALLGKTFVWSGLAILTALYLVMIAGPLFASITLPLILRTILFTLVAFLPPSLMIASISPQLTKLFAHNVEKMGLDVGSLVAWNTVGGLLGALGTGFFFISWFGTRNVLGLLAVLCLFIGIIVSRPVFPLRRRGIIVVVGLLILLFIAPRTCLTETRYYCVQVLKDPSFSEQNPAYILRLDHLVHSYIRPNHSEMLGYGYEQVYAHLIATRYAQDQSFSSLFIGGGGYVLPRYLTARYPTSPVSVAEIDPGVTEVNHTALGLPKNTPIETHNMDARMYLARLPSDKKFELVFGDAFNDFSVPYHLTTLEFHRLLKSHMTKDGVYALNIIDDPSYGQFLSAMIQTLSAVWGHVYVAPGADEFVKGRNTIVLLATDKELDPTTWQTTVSPAAQEAALEERDYRAQTQWLSSSTVEAFVNGHPVPVLRDSFAPTDRYLAPVFTDAY